MRLRRSGIALASARSRSAGEIAVMFAATEGHAREVNPALNDSGFTAPSPNGKAADHHCHPKRYFAVNSKIRRPDYLPNVA
ncbi:hypothetical protein [Saccharopolyspora sp. MS10]|uniref:hypothetical protein n=1 Tax=Saccharopolyspora sp. MS10 TaxID=3385973 RepID=UPI0039A38FE4